MKLILVMAMTLDGRIGKSADHFPDWTARGDKRLFAEVSRRAGVVIMGARTYDTLGAPLPERLNIVITRNRARISQHENLLFTDAEPPAVLAELSRRGFSEAVLAGGAQINALFARHQLIDEIVVTISPVIFGAGLSLFTPDISMNLRLEQSRPLGGDLVCLHYRVLKNTL